MKWAAVRSLFGCILLLNQILFDNNVPFNNTTLICLLKDRTYSINDKMG